MLNVVIAGVAAGMMYGLLGLAIVLLFKMTGVPNFAQGSLATAGAFLVYLSFTRLHLPLMWAVLLGLLLSAILGVAMYLLVVRFADDAGPLNLTVRTLGLYLFVFALLNELMGQGQPLVFPNLFPVSDLRIGAARVSEGTLGIVGIAVLLVVLLGAFFRYTRTGLLLRGMAVDRETARLLGVDVRRLTAFSWILSTVLAAVVGTLTAPTTLLSADMMDNSLLFVFAAVVIGGLTSLGGAFVGGIIVGVVQGVVYSWSGADMALLAVFGLFLTVLLLRPHGLFGVQSVERF